MAKLINFPLEMADGTKARSIEELREHADIASITTYYKNGKLYRWLLANYLDDVADKIKSICDSDNKRCMESKQLSLKDIVTAIGISSINEAQIAEYDFNESGDTSNEKLSGNYAVEIEDDAELKAKLKPLVSNNEIDLDEWKICMDKSEKENSKVVCIQNKNSGLFVSFDLKDDETLNKTIISSLKNLKKLKSIIDNTASDNSTTSRQQSADMSAFECKTDNGEWVLIKLKDTSLKHVVIPDFITSVGRSAFRDCFNLESIEIPNSVTSVGSSAFINCSNLKTIGIPNSVTSIGGCTFQGCSNLESIELPNSVTSIQDCAFQGCSNLKNIKIPDSVTLIKAGTFQGCSSLKTVEIPKSVKNIGSDAFRDCFNLESIEIPDSVEYIGSNAFRNCFNLKTIEIPKSVKSIGEHAFEGCNKLISDLVENFLRNQRQNQWQKKISSVVKKHL